MPNYKTLTVLGAGSWGSALVSRLAANQVPLVWWGRDSAQMARIAAAGQVPGASHSITAFVTVETDLQQAVSTADVLLVVVPSAVFADFLSQILPFVSADTAIVWGTKGLDPARGCLLHEVVTSIMGERAMAMLSGPNLAHEVLAGMPACTVVAGTDQALLQQLQQWFQAPSFRTYANHDLIGVQLCSVYKNILAIACGMADGLACGQNARAALLTRGIAEMGRLLDSLGGERATLLGLAGMGDLLLTATSADSRNRRFGLALGQGLTADNACAQIGQVVEGRGNAALMHQLALAHNLSLPILEQVYQVIFSDCSVKDAMAALLGRMPPALE